MTTRKQIIKELQDNADLLHKVEYGSYQWSILYATQQALEWVLDSKTAMAPVKMFKKFKDDYRIFKQ